VLEPREKKLEETGTGFTSKKVEGVNQGNTLIVIFFGIQGRKKSPVGGGRKGEACPNLNIIVSETVHREGRTKGRAVL